MRARRTAALRRSLFGVIRFLAEIAVLSALGPGGATAQVLSPGQLAEPHAELEGVRHCTGCHEAGT